MKRFLFTLGIGFLLAACSKEEIAPYPCLDGDCIAQFYIDEQVQPNAYEDANGYWHIEFYGPKYFTIRGELSELADHYVINGVPLIETQYDSDYWVAFDTIQFTVPTYSVLSWFSNGNWNNLIPDTKDKFIFHHVSTDEVYGDLDDSGLFNEETRYDPSSPYSASKASSDHLVRAWHRTYGLPIIITNCSNNYGAYQYPEKLIPLIILNALEGMPLPVYGSGKQVRDWLYVEDHAKALRLSLENGKIGQTYNIGGHNEKTNIEVVNIICDLLDKLLPLSQYIPHRSLISHVSDRPGHDKRYAVDAKKIQENLNWLPDETFESGIEKTVKWYLENKEWCQNIKDKRQRYGIGSK